MGTIKNNMLNNKLISKHFQININQENINTICIMCGKQINQGIYKKNVISDVFTDYEYLKYKSDYFCIDCAKVILPIIKTEKGYNSLRNYSYCCDNENFNLIQKKDMEYYLFEYVFHIPYIFVISFNQKKHLAYRSQINMCNKIRIITTDIGIIKINKQDHYKLFKILKNWYKYFNKNEILNNPKFSNIEKYGINKFFQENQYVKKFRNTLELKLLVNILYKKKEEIDDKN